LGQVPAIGSIADALGILGELGCAAAVFTGAAARVQVFTIPAPKSAVTK
jgi:hypothetical protein